MKKQPINGMTLKGSFRKAGMTFYVRQGQTIARVSRSTERRSNTLPQFVQRQRMRHSIALWHMLQPCEPMFTQRKTAYLDFASLANRLPAVYIPNTMHDASLLIPGIPVSDGTLPTVKQQLGEYSGTAALLTKLKASDVRNSDVLRLYTAKQCMEAQTPVVQFSVRTVPMAEFITVDGYLALAGDTYADDDKGWALVRVNNERCSPQTLLTRSTFYQRYTTDEALQEAAESYGGLTE